MKKKIFFKMALLSIIFINTLKSDDAYPLVELFVINSQSTPLYIKFYPISSTFTKHCNPCISKFRLKTELNQENGEQRFRRGDPPYPPLPPLLYMVGLDGWALENRGSYDGYFELTQNITLYLDHEYSGSATGADGLFGYGLYNLEIYKTTNGGANFVLVTPESIKIDCSDLNYPYFSPMMNDLTLTIYDITTHPPNITFYWSSNAVGTNELSIYSSNLPEEDKGNFKFWRQWHFLNNQLTKYEVTPNQNPTRYGITDPNFLLYPIDGKLLPSPYSNQYSQHVNPGLLVSPLFIQSGHNAKVKCSKWFVNYNLLRLNGAQNNYAVFTVADIPSANCNATFVNGTSGTIEIPQYATFNVENGGKLYLENQSHLNFENFSTSNLNLKNGSTYCNQGAIINRPGHIRIEKGVKYCIPNPPSRVINIVSDSARIILETGAVFEIPDSTTYIFEGNESAFICSDSSTIKFGKDAKLIFNDGARIKAKYTKFTSLDSTDTWDGIYLNDFAFDTLQYCTIENAVNGINKEDLTTSLNDPATEISNCIFSNTTQAQLLNMVYVNGGRNVMIRNCSSSSSISNGFYSGIIIEYTDAGEVNVIDCDIDYVTTGISIIQSSTYIARNTITGTGNDGAGIFLDNSNGTIEYNNVLGFDIAVQLYYSSPYMLKNTFNSTSVSCADFTASSVPVLRPVISGTTSRWLGGNNFFTGSSVEVGIRFTDGGYPLMDSGYNVIDVGNSNYIEGSPDDLLYARVNNWTDDPPNSGQFAVGGAGIDYSNPFNGEPLPLSNYYDLYSIGFGFYDTVYYDYIGDNPTPEELFMQAYLKEMTGYYSDPVTLYKNVISEYKTSKYAVSSLSRIFNCLEKAQSNNSVYNAIKAYYDNLKSSNNCPTRLREVAEDFAIKSKVKMGFIEDAISDYQTIINNNPNTSKGFHAQINKLCLENMNGGGDMFMMGNKPTNEHYKSGLLSLITNKKLNVNKTISSSIPKQFKLYQNYPNPFNPKTTIKFDIPINGQVSLKVYDIAGRELFSINEYKSAGSYEVNFDGTNFASGLYLYQLSVGNYVRTMKMVLLK